MRPIFRAHCSSSKVETDVLLWKEGGWNCVLTHETNVQGTFGSVKSRTMVSVPLSPDHEQKDAT